MNYLYKYEILLTNLTQNEVFQIVVKRYTDEIIDDHDIYAINQYAKRQRSKEFPHWLLTDKYQAEWLREEW